MRKSILTVSLRAVFGADLDCCNYCLQHLSGSSQATTNMTTQKNKPTLIRNTRFEGLICECQMKSSTDIPWKKRRKHGLQSVNMSSN
jgi:hypothetical protein